MKVNKLRLMIRIVNHITNERDYFRKRAEALSDGNYFERISHYEIRVSNKRPRNV
jgi:hypothetical protein